MRSFGKGALWAVAAFYLYGAAVHVLNMLSLTGFDWGTAPAKWQALDVVYLALDLLVVIFLPPRRTVGILAFYATAISQVVLYTVLRPWILDVPPEFRRPATEIAYLDGLILFHLVSVVLVSAALWILRGRG